jgi:hypothetical protein
MNRPLKKTERQLFNCYIYLRYFHQSSNQHLNIVC